MQKKESNQKLNSFLFYNSMWLNIVCPPRNYRSLFVRSSGNTTLGWKVLASSKSIKP